MISQVLHTHDIISNSCPYEISDHLSLGLRETPSNWVPGWHSLVGLIERIVGV